MWDMNKRYFLVWVNAVDGHSVGEIQRTFELCCEDGSGALTNMDIEAGNAVLAEVTLAQKDPNSNVQAVLVDGVWTIQDVV